MKHCSFASGCFLGGLELTITACICRMDKVAQSLFFLADSAHVKMTQQKVPGGSLWRTFASS